jgi:hypothetical protein
VQVKQISKYQYRVKRERETRKFTDGEDGDYKRWLKEQRCVVCGKQPCDAHHEPSVGNSGRDHGVYWKVAVPLCVDCHRRRHDKGFSKRVMNDLSVWARKFLPRRFVRQLFNIIGKGG